ncbi:MAG TPA: VTT domain-containing protein [Gemmatimonadales bacterium]|nr:VTT domain-containing protein [Gemmatimonadales bacterium]
MNDVTAYLIEHGYVVLFVWVAAEQLALPVPSEPVLLAAGALAGAGLLELPVIVAVGVTASLLSDVIWYEIGRARGSQVTRLLCRISLEPDSCVRRSQDMFARYGGWALVVAKFVPGLNTVAQPLAGVLGMRRSRFLLVDVLGALLWIGTYTGLGYLLSDEVERVAAHGRSLGTWLFGLVFGSLALYIAGKYIRRRRFIGRLRIARITPVELKRKLETGEMPMIVDLRHTVDFDTDPVVIPGAVHVSPEELERRWREIPLDRDVILYCT